jgi:cell division protein FtsB
MYEKCIACKKIGESCVPNLMLLPFPDLMQWSNKRQKHLGWTNQTLADKSKVPIGTINRLKAGDYLDCKYSTIRSILIALIGGTTDEWQCTEQVERELAQKELLEQYAAKTEYIEQENTALKAQIDKTEEQHRADIRIIRTEYQEQIAFLKERISFLTEQVKAWQSR